MATKNEKNVSGKGYASWADAMNDPSVSMKDRIEAYKQDMLERRSADIKQQRGPSASILKTDEDRRIAAEIGPKVFARLVEEHRWLMAGVAAEECHLLGFAEAYGSIKTLDGRWTKGPYKYISNLAWKVARSPLMDIDFQQVQGNGGTLAERLATLASLYKKVYGNLSFLAEAKLIKEE